MTANLTCSQIIFPSRSDQITSHHTLYRKHFSATHEHRAASQHLCMTTHGFRHFIDIAGEQVVCNNVSQFLKPELGKRGEHFTFSFDGSRQYAIESGNAIRRHDQQTLIVYSVNVAHFTAPD